MPVAASKDLRQRVVDAYLSGRGSVRELAEDFSLNFKSVHRWVQRFRSTGSVAPKPPSGGPPRKIDAAGELVVRDLVKAQPDATLVELCAQYEARTGVSVSDTTMCALLQELKLPRKKSQRTPASSSAATSRSNAPSSRSRRAR